MYLRVLVYSLFVTNYPGHKDIFQSPTIASTFIIPGTKKSYEILCCISESMIKMSQIIRYFIFIMLDYVNI